MDADRLIKLRKSLGLTQNDIAKKLNITRSTYANYEAGRIKPSYDILIALANFFNVSVDYLVGRMNDPHAISSENNDKDKTFDHQKSAQTIETIQSSTEKQPDLQSSLQHIEARLDRIEHHLALITGFGMDELLLLRRLKEHPKMIPWLMEFIEAPEETKEKTMRVWAAFLPEDQYWEHYRRLREELGLENEEKDVNHNKNDET